MGQLLSLRTRDISWRRIEFFLGQRQKWKASRPRLNVLVFQVLGVGRDFRPSPEVMQAIEYLLDKCSAHGSVPQALPWGSCRKVQGLEAYSNRHSMRWDTVSQSSILLQQRHQAVPRVQQRYGHGKLGKLNSGSGSPMHSLLTSERLVSSLPDRGTFEILQVRQMYRWLVPAILDIIGQDKESETARHTCRSGCVKNRIWSVWIIAQLSIKVVDRYFLAFKPILKILDLNDVHRPFG